MKKALLSVLLVGSGMLLFDQLYAAEQVENLVKELKEEVSLGEDNIFTPEDIADAPEPEALPQVSQELSLEMQPITANSGEAESDTGSMQEELLMATVPEEEKTSDIETDDIVQGFLRHTGSSFSEETVAPVIPTDQLMFDIEEKRKDVVALVTRAVQALETQPLDIACNKFSHTKEFILGDLYIFVFDINGICLAHGDDAYLIWKNMIDDTDWLGTPIVKQIIKKANAGGGWVTYGWDNSTKVSYVRLVEKEGHSYVIGSGYFPHSKEETVVNLVKAGVALFNQVKKAGDPIYWAFSRMSYPSGAFVAGNLYLYALDFKGNILAQGERPGLINTNALDYQDERGLFVNQEIMKKLDATTEGVWVEYISKRALKKSYAEKVVDKQGNKYFIACGYYPDANRQATMDLVRKGYQFMKTAGKTSAVTEFSQRRSDEYRYGDLFLVVYDLKGNVVADGGNSDNIGRNMYNAVDQDGFPYIRRIIRRATKEGIWSNAKIQGYFQSTFAQKVDLGIDQFVITCNYYPVSKPETMMLLVQSGVSFLQANPRDEAFAEFIKRDGKFRRGDLQLVVIDTEGLCYAYGDDVDLIWRNIIGVTDEAGRPFIKWFINETRQGSTVLKTKLNNSIKTNYVTSLDKGGKTYVISSGYYQ